MEKFIFCMEVHEKILPKKMNWLGEWEEEVDVGECKNTFQVLYFPTFEEMSQKINELTRGYHQYWADVYDDHHGNNVENLEYHNGRGEWDGEIYIETSRVYLTESLMNAIKIQMGE